MQKTITGKKVFMPFAQLRPSEKLSKSVQKFFTHKGKLKQTSSQQLVPQQTLQKLNQNPSFQYYLFQKNTSVKQLNKLKKCQSAQDLLKIEKRKQNKLNRDLNGKYKQLQKIYDDTPFYTNYKPLPIQNDPQLADYGLFYKKRNLKRQKSPSHYFQKVRQNKHNFQKYRQTKGMISPQRLKTQENYQIQSEKCMNTSSKYNLSLSPFEFGNTIEGKLATSLSRNLRMDLNKTKKSQNVNKVWYNTNEDVERNHENFKDIRKSVEYQQKIKKCHSFDSYKGHKLFQSKINKEKVPADQIFYDANGEAKQMGFYSRWKTQNHINMQKMTNRQKQPEKLGTNLDYQMQDLKPLKSPSKRNSMGNSSSERKLVFSRQVINQAKGCYR